jgi:hypothetical protein
MRITLTLDDDVLSAAKTLAAQRHETIGAVISDLVWQVLASPPVPILTRNGAPLLPRREDGGPMTLETVNLLRDELLPSEPGFQA